MKNRIIDRLIQYLQHHKVSAYAFERTCGVGNGYLKKQQKGKGGIGSDILEKIHHQYPDLDLVWLLTGEGRMAISHYLKQPSIVQEEDLPYNADQKIKSLEEKIAILEAALTDKQKIIQLMENLTTRQGKK